MEQIVFYFGKYAWQIVLSLVYFASLSLTGFFLILRRASLFGMVTTGASQAALLIGASLHFYVHNTDAYEVISEAETNRAELFHLDIYLLPIIALFLLPLVHIIRNRKINTEAFLAALFVVFMAALPLIHALSGGSDIVLSKIYFSEILYNPPEVFAHYIPVVLLLLLVFAIWYRPLFLSGFDPVQARLAGIPERTLNTLFYFWAGFMIALGARTLGGYVSLAALLLPPLSILGQVRSMQQGMLVVVVLSILLALSGFVMSFILEALPAEPVLIVWFSLGSGLVWIFGKR